MLRVGNDQRLLIDHDMFDFRRRQAVTAALLPVAVVPVEPGETRRLRTYVGICLYKCQCEPMNLVVPSRAMRGSRSVSQARYSLIALVVSFGRS